MHTARAYQSSFTDAFRLNSLPQRVLSGVQWAEVAFIAFHTIVTVLIYYYISHNHKEYNNLLNNGYTTFKSQKRANNADSTGNKSEVLRVEKAIKLFGLQNN